MTYKQLQLSAYKKATKTTTLGSKGENLLSLPELMNNDFSLLMENFIILGDAKYQKCKGLTSVIDNGTTPITKSIEVQGIRYYGQGDKVYANDGVTDSLVYTMEGTGDFDFTKFGSYIYVTNFTEKVGRITRALDYDTGTVDFSVGSIVTDSVTGATATILEISGATAAGTLTLGNIEGIFGDGNLITDLDGGSASVDGSLLYEYQTITQAPVCKGLFSYDQRIVAYCTNDNESQILWSNKYIGVNPPGDTWIPTGTPPLTTDPGSTSFSNAGAVNSVTTLGGQLVGLYEDGESGVRIETVNIDGTGLRQNVISDFQREGIGGDASISTNIGVFYVNNNGVFQMSTGGSTSQPFSKQEVKISSLFSEEFLDTINFSNADLFHDEKKNLIYITCRQESDFNNLVLIYNTKEKSFTRRTGWYISSFLKSGDDILGTSAITGKIFKLFDGNSDDGVPISCLIRQELTNGDTLSLNQLQEIYAKGKLSNEQIVTISFDIYDKDGILRENIKTADPWSLGASDIKNIGIGKSSIGKSSIGGGGAEGSQTFESWLHQKLRIYQYSRIIVNIQEESELPLEINYLSLITKPLGRNLNYTQ